MCQQQLDKSAADTVHLSAGKVETRECNFPKLQLITIKTCSYCNSLMAHGQSKANFNELLMQGTEIQLLVATACGCSMKSSQLKAYRALH
jgi:hypothetical protein